MRNEPRALKEIHAIREQIYAETKGMTAAEYNALVNKEVGAMINKYGLKIRRPDMRI
jgi:hypothetical protein